LAAGLIGKAVHYSVHRRPKVHPMSSFVGAKSVVSRSEVSRLPGIHRPGSTYGGPFEPADTYRTARPFSTASTKPQGRAEKLSGFLQMQIDPSDSISQAGELTKPIVRVAEGHALVAQAGKDVVDSLLQRGKTAGRVTTTLGAMLSLVASGGLIASVFVHTGIAGLVIGTFAAPYIAIPAIVAPVLAGVLLGVCLRAFSRRNFGNNAVVRDKVDALRSLEKKLQQLPSPNFGETNLLKHTSSVLHRLHMLGVPMENDYASFGARLAGRLRAPLRDSLRLGALGICSAVITPIGGLICAAVHFGAQSGGGKNSAGGPNPALCAPYYGWSWGAANPFLSRAKAGQRLAQRNVDAENSWSDAAQFDAAELKALGQNFSPTA
jgi:hypothetical protein